MESLRARVINGRLIMDQPTDLPEGLVLDLVVDDEGDDLDAEELRLLESKIVKSLEDAKAGRVHPAAEFLRELRDKR
jgi:hypothetical protein